jgi:hypothetical protein
MIATHSSQEMMDNDTKDAFVLGVAGAIFNASGIDQIYAHWPGGYLTAFAGIAFLMMCFYNLGKIDEKEKNNEEK